MKSALGVVYPDIHFELRKEDTKDTYIYFEGDESTAQVSVNRETKYEEMQLPHVKPYVDASKAYIIWCIDNARRVLYPHAIDPDEETPQGLYEVILAERAKAEARG